ncbi:HalX domain-containing protein [Halopenitus persicus]|uniref:Response regulator receiver domain-containing protein n=1 Tax=Halopenitus persicus TaxID=1048396 RepID=A0A1H3LJL8_9EURY|nr:HalX domain-containing protein [Halopenitus persicus]SDY64737.1 Response regulator receiver domain-containing protein [Halopenitus persicus]
MDATEFETESVTVLVVDDEQGLADLYAAWIDEEESYSTRTAYDGEQAFDRIDETVDLVLLDRRMPGLSGDEVLEAIRDRGYDCRVVMVTAVNPDFDVLELPFDEYVVKPLDEEAIHDVVERMLARTNYDEQLQRLYALTSKKAALEAEKSQQELDQSDEFAALESDLEELQSSLDETIADFEEEEDFDATLQGLPGDRNSDE